LQDIKNKLLKSEKNKEQPKKSLFDKMYENKDEIERIETEIKTELE
jgi:hypothetical protein